MRCDRTREAISARIDGEDAGVPDGAIEAHLATCAACRSWQQRAHAMTRRARLGGSFLERDLTSQVLAAVPPEPDRRRHSTGRGGRERRAGLAAVAVVQLAITIPLLILGHDHDAGLHAAHELGSFDLALAIAFAVGAVRPALSAGLAWPCGIAAGALAVTAIADLLAGQTFGADEAQHLVALVGAVLLCWQARTVSGPAEPVLAALLPEALLPEALLPEAVLPEAIDPGPGQRAEIPPESPGGSPGGGPDIAARRGHDGDHREAVA